MKPQTLLEYCQDIEINLEGRDIFLFHPEILDRLKLVINQALIKHSRISFFEVNLHFPPNCKVPSDNRYIIEFMERYIEKFEQQNLSPHYLWVRERKKGKNQHYHVVIMLDAHEITFNYEHITLAEDLWQELLNEGGYQFESDKWREYYFAKYFSLMVYRNSEETLGNALYWGSHLAKVRTKEKGLKYPKMGSTKLYTDY